MRIAEAGRGIEIMNFRMLIWHAESEALFECFDEKEANEHLYYSGCEDVTNYPKFEQRFKEEQSMSTRPNSAAAARAAAIARTKQKAKEGQNRFAGKSCIKTDLKPLEKKDGATTRVSVICYTVTEKHHPDGIKPGEKWWRRPWYRHRQIGAGDEARDIVCPRSFNPRSECSPCEEASELRKGKWEDIKDVIGKVDRSLRWLLLVYDHDAKEYRYMDEAYGGKKNPSFGLLLDMRLANPRQEDWAGFWLDDDLGYALDISWIEADFMGNKFFKAAAIDFVERKKAPLPKDVYSKAFDLSEMLVKISSEEVEKLHLQLPDEEAQDPGESPTKVDRGSRKESPKKEEKEPPPDDDDPPFSEVAKTFDEMNKEELLEWAKTCQLKDANDKLIYRFHARKSEDEIRALVKEAEGQADPPEEEGGEGEECKYFGSSEHFGTREECQNCPDATYNACGDKADDK